MPDYFSEYGYASSGWDAAAADFTNFEATFSLPYLSAPHRIPRGSVTSEIGDGSEVVDGWRKISLEQVGDPYGTTLFADLNVYVTAVHGGWDGDDAEISLKTRDLDGSFTYWNVIAHFPQIGQDYEHITSAEIRDLKLRYTVINSYTPA